MQEYRNLTTKVQNTILKHNMLQSGDNVVVAVSGGPDSVCLLEILNELSTPMNINLIIAHYNHGLRKSEDDDETRLVENLAEKYKLPVECETASDLHPDMASLEDAARKSRYNFLESVRTKYNADKIALGHNLNDQAETFLMRLLRGSGMSGLSGIHPVRDHIIIRPLLETKREEILDYLAFCKISYSADSSNSNKRFLRNRIRLELVPELIDYQPKIIENLGKLSSYFREEDEFINLEAAKWVNTKLQERNNNCFYIELPAFNKLPHPFARRILRIIISKFINNLHGIDSEHINSILKLAQNKKPNKSIHLPKRLNIKKEYNNLFFSIDDDYLEPFIYSINKPGSVQINETGQKILIERIKRIEKEPAKSLDPATAILDGGKVKFPITVRSIKHGDRFIPLGMKGHKKIKDFFIDLKVPLNDRRSTPLLVHDDEIFWVCGYRIDDRYKVTPDTKTILKCKIKKEGR